MRFVFVLSFCAFAAHAGPVVSMDKWKASNPDKVMRSQIQIELSKIERDLLGMKNPTEMINLLSSSRTKLITNLGYRDFEDLISRVQKRFLELRPDIPQLEKWAVEAESSPHNTSELRNYGLTIEGIGPKDYITLASFNRITNPEEYYAMISFIRTTMETRFFDQGASLEDAIRLQSLVLAFDPLLPLIKEKAMALVRTGEDLIRVLGSSGRSLEGETNFEILSKNLNTVLRIGLEPIQAKQVLALVTTPLSEKAIENIPIEKLAPHLHVALALSTNAQEFVTAFETARLLGSEDQYEKLERVLVINFKTFEDFGPSQEQKDRLLDLVKSKIATAALLANGAKLNIMRACRRIIKSAVQVIIP